MKQTILIEAISLLFVILFLYTGISKMIEYPLFREVISQSVFLQPFSSWIARLIPITEIIISILLFIPFSRLHGLYAAFSLMLVFTGYTIYILNFSPHLPCGCGGILESMTWPMHLIFNIISTIIALIGIYLKRNQRKKMNMPIHQN
ncbi:MauE/DoxX family redox-associated membrane protein [Chitinophaga sp. MM2321]|uniref:MauE/DoxX family redox-associated membrane protein n=1 Tax=Chitinophaga sp. MM2321 TaxID=3137178 RepID=UPI0032D59348